MWGCRTHFEKNQNFLPENQWVGYDVGLIEQPPSNLGVAFYYIIKFFTSCHQVFLHTFPLDLLEMGPCAIVGHVWNYYVITRFFVHFPMGFPWNGLVCGVVGHILKRTKIFFLKTSGWVTMLDR